MIRSREASDFNELMKMLRPSPAGKDRLGKAECEQRHMLYSQTILLHMGLLYFCSYQV